MKLRPSGQRIIPSRTPLFDYDLRDSLCQTHFTLHIVSPLTANIFYGCFLGAVVPLGRTFYHHPLVDGRQVQSAELDPTKTAAFDLVERQDLGGKVQEFRTKVTAGDHWVAASILKLYEGLPARYHGPESVPARSSSLAAVQTEGELCACGNRRGQKAV